MGPRERFVGRDVESAALRADLDAALLGEGRLVRIEGESGIGKTFLARWLAAEAEARGANTVWGRCREQAGSPEYWPWIQALEASGHVAGRDAARHLDARPDRVDPLASPEPARARFELHDRVTRSLVEIASERPLVIVLDDLQWAGDGSLDLLAFAASELASLPVLVVAAMRTSGEGRLERIRSLGRGLRMGGLTATETGQLLTREIGHEPPRGLAEQVHQLTSGSPFFVIELAQLLASSSPGDDAANAPVLPPRAKEILGRRLASISDASRTVLLTAAVLGLEFRLDYVARALGLSLGEVTARLEAPFGSEIVHELPGALQQFVFSHALVRDALYEAMPKRERAMRHMAVARAMEEGQGGDARDRVYELSHHYFEAARVGDPQPAIHYACAAGELALERLAFEEAVRQFTRALAAVELAERARTVDRVRALVGYGIACRMTERDEAGAEPLRQGLGLARQLGPIPFAESVLRVALQRAEFAVPDLETIGALREALAGLPEAPSLLRAQLMARLASGLHLQPDAEEERLEMSRSAVELARELADPPTLSFALSRRLASLLTPDHAEERARVVTELLADPNTTPRGELESRLFQIDDLAEAADRKSLDAALAVFEHKANAARLPYFLWQVTCNRAALALLEGRFAEAEQLAGAALAQGQRVAPQSAGLRFAQHLFSLRSWQQRMHEVMPLLERTVETTQVVPGWRCVLASIYSVTGREAEARREFEALAAGDFRELPRDSNWLVGMSLLADACNRLGDAERAESLYRQLLPHSGRVAMSHPFIVLNCPVDLRLGSLALRVGDPEQAIAHHEKALGIADRMRALTWQAEVRYHLAAAYSERAATGDLELALALLEDAEAIAKPIGMSLVTGWIATARAGLQRRQASVSVATGTHGRGSERVDNVVRLPGPRTTGSQALFRREGEIWSLAFEGRATRFKHMRGLAHLARLLAEPGREFHAAELAGAPQRPDPGDAGEQLDARARVEYEARLREARDDLEDAERLNDRGRAERRSEEVEWLTQELARGFGLGGRERRAGSASERARLSVRRAIKYAIDKIEPHDAALAEHLRRNVRTGTFCSYAPASREEVVWTL